MWKSPIAGVLLALTAILSPPAAADNEVLKGVGTFCDTRELAIRFLKGWDGTNTPELLAEVNAGSGAKSRCRVATVSYAIMRRFGIYQTPKGEWQVVQALILKIGLPTGRVVSPRTPLLWYSYAQPNTSKI